MTCKHCGKDFKPRRGNQKFCCTKCRKSSYRKCPASQKPKPVIHKVCIECGKPFTATRSIAEYCSDACKNEKYKVKGDRNRELTDLTPYLCQKWHREGMPIKQIAELLNRSAQSVKKALAVPLTKQAYEEMQEYAK